MQCLLRFCFFSFFVVASFQVSSLNQSFANEYRAFRAHLHFAWLVCVRASVRACTVSVFSLLKLWMRFDCSITATAAPAACFGYTLIPLKQKHVFASEILYCTYVYFCIAISKCFACGCADETFMKLLLMNTNTNTQRRTSRLAKWRVLHDKL